MKDLQGLVASTWGRLPATLRLAIGLYLAVRLPVELLATTAADLFPPGPGARGMPPLDGPKLLQAWLRWDSGWYVRIIRDGFTYADCLAPTVPCPQASIAFLPGFPMLVRAVTWTGLSLTVSSFVVVHAALVAAVWGLLELAKLKGGDDEAATRSALAMLAFPSAIFLSAGYAEGLFMACAVWSLVHLERGARWQAAVLLTVAALTRSQGMLLVGAVGLVALARRDWRTVLILGGLSGAAVGSYLAWQHQSFGDALAFVHARRGWGFTGQPAIAQAGQYWLRTWNGELALEGWKDFASIAWLSACAVWSWRRLGAVYGLFVALLLVVPMASGQVWALSRIALCAFPGFLLLGAWTNRRLPSLGLFVAGLAFVVISALTFASGYFTGS